jgi:hypothetical protein
LDGKAAEAGVVTGLLDGAVVPFTTGKHGHESDKVIHIQHVILN